MAQQIPYVGFVQTATAEKVVRNYLFKRTWDSMCKPGSRYYEPTLRNLLASSPEPETEQSGGGGAAAPQQTGGGAPAQSKIKTKAGATETGQSAKPNPALLEALKKLTSTGTGGGKNPKASPAKPKTKNGGDDPKSAKKRRKIEDEDEAEEDSGSTSDPGFDDGAFDGE